MKRGVIAISLFVASFSLGAIEISGQWEFLPLVVALPPSMVPADADLPDGSIVGENLLFLEAGLMGLTDKLALRVDPDRRALFLESEEYEFRRRDETLVIQSGESRIEFTFTQLGDVLVCQMAAHGEEEFLYIGELIPGEGARVGGKAPPEVTGGFRNDAPSALPLPGKRFRNSSKGIALEFRSEQLVAVYLDGTNTGVYRYTRDGNRIYMEDPQSGMVEFEMVDSSTLYTDQWGLQGYYDLQ